MAYEAPILQTGMEHTSVDLSGSQFYAVKFDVNGNLILANVAGERIYGILQNKPKPNWTGTVMQVGYTKAVAGAAVAKFQELAVDATGRLVPAAAGNYVVGIALTPAGGAGEDLTVELVNYKI